MAQATGRRYVEARLELIPPRCHLSNAKAQELLEYEPKYTMFDMIDQAVGRQNERFPHSR